jgi:hypothetical protein
MKITDVPITARALASMAQRGSGDLGKAMVDVERGIIAVDGELHSDEEAPRSAPGSFA